MKADLGQAEVIAAGLSEAQRRVVLALDDHEARLPGRETFNASSAYSLGWVTNNPYSFHGHEITKRVYVDGKRHAYRLTPLGLRVRSILERKQS